MIGTIIFLLWMLVPIITLYFVWRLGQVQWGYCEMCGERRPLHERGGKGNTMHVCAYCESSYFD